MAGRTIELELNRQQMRQMFAHLAVYLVCQKDFPAGPPIELIKKIASVVFALHEQGSARATLQLSAQEEQALAQVFRFLALCYSRHLTTERDGAARDLARCQALLERAKRRSGKN